MVNCQTCARAARVPCIEKIYENLRKPARVRRARYALVLYQSSRQYALALHAPVGIEGRRLISPPHARILNLKAAC